MASPQILWGTNYEFALNVDIADQQAGSRALRQGSTAVFDAGTEEAWVTGYDYQLSLLARWIPPSDIGNVSGQYSWQDFLDFARDKGTFRYVPDSAFPDFYADGCYLAAPMEDDIQLEFNEEAAIGLVIRNPLYDFSLLRRGLFIEWGPGGLTPPIIAYTAAGRRSWIDTTNVLRYAESGVLRDRDQLYGSRTITLEPEVINRCPQPENLESSPWTSTDASVTANATVAPTRGFSADKIVEGTGSAQHTRHFEFSASASEILSATVYLKKGERTKVQVYFSDSFAGADKMGCQIDLDTLAISNITSGAGVIRSAPKARFISPLAGSWVELRFSGVVTTSTLPDFVIRLCDAAGAGTYTGDGTSGLFAWGVMVSRALTGTFSYFNGTKVADSVVGQWPWKPQAMWIYLKFIELGGANQFGFDGPFRLGLVDSAPKKFLRFDTFTGPPSNYRFTHQDGVIGQSSSASGIPLVGQTVELLGVLNADGSVFMKQSINGAADTTGSTSAAFALDNAWTTATFELPKSYPIGLMSLKAGPGVAVNTMALARLA